MKNILGISAGYHDAGVTVLNPYGDILFASHSERYSKQKHDSVICNKILDEAEKYGDIGTVAYYEKHLMKNLRMLRAGQPINQWNWKLRSEMVQHLPNHAHLLDANLVSFNHHKSHAAAGFQTSPYDDATVMVIDAIGEFQTATIWEAYYDKDGIAKYKLKWQMRYPNSIGLFYSAFTKAVGLRPLDEEYILMGMAAYGNAKNTRKTIEHDVIHSYHPLVLKENLHLGLNYKYEATDFDIAAGAQEIVEDMITYVLGEAVMCTNSKNLVYMGGVALNCSANRNLGMYYDNIWIMPNPGDCGSSLGAAALAYGKKINWDNAYLGQRIAGKYPVKEILQELETNKIVGVANGRAEFGPRALGNRSLLADPRGTTIKDEVNKIKRRQKFRPFAPVILEEYANEHFIMPRGFNKSEYMQVTAYCRNPEEFPAIVHADGTSRVQTVPKNNSGIRKLLEAFYKKTRCPMLLNTSLNIRGMPMVNDEQDARDFEQKYNVKVFTKSL